MKTTFLLLICFLTFSCVHPVLNKKDYVIVDTIRPVESGAGLSFGYDVIIKYSDDYYFAHLSKNGEITEVVFKKLNVYKPINP